MYNCGILTVSDSSYFENNIDKSGLALSEELKNIDFFSVAKTLIVPDNINKIENTLITWSDEDKLDLILTTGGTGLTKRDITPEATRKVIEREVPGIPQGILYESLKITKYAMMSRAVAGVRKSSLIINLPGSPKAVKECFSIISPILKHAVDQLADKTDTVKAVHSKMQINIPTTIDISPSQVAQRPRQSQYPVLKVEEAFDIVIRNCDVLSSEFVDIIDSLYMVPAETIVSNVNVPPFPASIKDGYATICSDGLGERKVICVSNAGDHESNIKPLEMGECVRISTGAPLPIGANSVVQIEDTIITTTNPDGSEKTINILVAPKQIGQDIRPIGNDLKIGDILLDNENSIVIGPAEIGVLAMGGVNKISCINMPIVGVLSTGNELISVNEVIDGPHIIDCNRPLLMALLRKHNFKSLDLGIVRDEPQLILNKLIEALKICDVIITTGSVSMGEKDYLKLVLEKDLSAEIHFGRVFMKPGKPTTFSTICNTFSGNWKKPIFSLPGNPVSSFVTFHLFVLPGLRKIAGIKKFENEMYVAELMHAMKLDSRPEYKRCNIKMDPAVDGYKFKVSCEEFGNQMSSRLVSCSGAEGLLVLPPITDSCNYLESGTLVQFIRL